MNVLDLAGVIMIGALGALSVQSLESKSPGNKVSGLLRILNLSHSSLQFQIVFIGVGAACLLISKTVLAVFFTRKTYFFLSSRAAEISVNTISRLLSTNILKIQSRSSQQTLFMVTYGVKDLMVGVLATTIQVFSDVFLLLIMLVGLIFVDPVMAISTMLIFSLVGFGLHMLLQVRARDLGKKSFKLTVASNEKILEVLGSYRELVVKNRRNFYASEIAKIRKTVANNDAESAFMPYISKYVIDSTTVLGTLILSGYEFAVNNAVHALSTITLFIAASSRIAPAALRIQQGFLTIRNSAGAAGDTANLISELSEVVIVDEIDQRNDFNYETFSPEIEIKDLEFSYPSFKAFKLDVPHISILAGSSAAFIGPSGSGKTTLIDLILGVLEPDSGQILISGKKPAEASNTWPGALAYVPQDVSIVNGSIRQNVGLGYPETMATDDRVNLAIRLAQLEKAVSDLPQGLDSRVGENGSKLSGGQRQRLGIARALFTAPKILVLDEATSALDGQTESDLGEAINSLKGNVTTLIVAHRLSTVQNVDQVIYVDKGKIIAAGTFQEVRNQVPNFNKQATLAGL
jgi:ABC-type multidrug transport system fused ATPase/permease subunit